MSRLVSTLLQSCSAMQNVMLCEYVSMCLGLEFCSYTTPSGDLRGQRVVRVHVVHCEGEGWAKIARNGGTGFELLDFLYLSADQIYMISGQAS